MITLTVRQLLTGAKAISLLGELDSATNSARVRWKGGTIKKVLWPDVIRAQNEQRGLYTAENSYDICAKCGTALPALEVTGNKPAPRECLACGQDASLSFAKKVKPECLAEVEAKMAELLKVEEQYNLPTFTLEELDNTPLTGDDMIALGEIITENAEWGKLLPTISRSLKKKQA